jgi:crotonobetainyl-CoA:carnitine CoA-transferase CaiB-like acyl-CoA transferase
MDSLKGRLILDCSVLLPGPFLGKLLAARGARVLKIESPRRPDPARDLGPYYDDLNSCKEYVPLDLLDTGDRAKFHELVKKADGLIEGYRPNAKKKLGLDEVSLHAVNPQLCIASLVGYSEDGPWRDRAGHDMNFSAVTGAASLFAEMPPIPIADLFSAYSGALGLVSAIDAVSRGARGARVAVSMAEVLKETLTSQIAEYRATGKLLKPGETLFSGAHPCYRIYRSRDGRRIAVGAIERKFWEKFLSIIGHLELVEDGYATGKKCEETVATVQAALSLHDWKHWAPLFDAADCCVEPVLDFSEVYGGL